MGRLRPLMSLFLVVAFVATPAPASADNGDRLTRRVKDGMAAEIYKALDAEGDVLAAGATIDIVAATSIVVIPVSGVDAGDTWSADCGFRTVADGSTILWTEVKAETASTASWAMPAHHSCEYFRVNKVTDTDDDTTVLLYVARPASS